MPTTDSTAPVGRPTPGPRTRAGLTMLIALLSLTALTAGIVTRMIPGLPTRQPGGERERLAEEVIVDEFAIKAEATALEHVVLQLELPRDCRWPDCTVPWGHVPEFTLFDDGQVIYTGTWDSPPYMVRHGYATEEESAQLRQELSDLIGPAMSPLPPTAHCPSGGGCADADAIVRIRREGRLETYMTSASSDGATEEAVFAMAELIQGWSPPVESFAFTPIMETIWDVTDGAADAAYPSPQLAPEDDATAFDERQLPSERLPVMVAQGEGVRLLAGSGALDAGSGAAQNDASERSLGRLFPEAFWYQPEGHWLMRPVFIRDGIPTPREPMKLAIVPWIYPNQDVDAQMDVEIYAEALANAITARANAYATADAALVPMADETALSAEPGDDGLSKQAYAPTATPFPTASFVVWSDDHRPTLPSARGIQTWMQWYRYDEDRLALIRLRQAGFAWFKQRFAWADMQPTGSQGMETAHSDLYIQTVNDLGGRVMIQLAVPPAWAVDAGSDDPFNLIVWERFVSSFANRYNGQVDAYEIMNEPNLAREWGGEPDPAAYARILKVAYDAIKAADGNAVVISAGLAPTGDRMPEAMGDETYLEALYDAMGAGGTEGDNTGDTVGTYVGGRYFDALGVHAAGFKAAPSVAPAEAAADPALGGHRTFSFRHVEDIRALMVDRDDGDRPIVVTEFGWTVDPRPDSSYHWAAVTPAERADHIGDAFGWVTSEFGWSDWLGPMILFSAADRAWTADDEAYWWAVADADGNVDGVVLNALGAGAIDTAED